MTTVLAHTGPYGLLAEAVTRWTWEPVTVTALIATAVMYFVGLRRLWQRAGRGAGIRRWEAAAFGAGLLCLACALLSPLAWLSTVLFSAHMTQHELLMLVAAPLLVFGRPLLAAFWAFAPRRREAIGRWIRRPAVARGWSAITGPSMVFVLHAAALWIWHVPAFFTAALVSESIHAVQHLSFVGTAALFWWGMVDGRYGRIGYGVGVLYVFLTAVHSSVLGALMTVAPTVWYPAYQRPATEWHIDALVDQQLAGLLMWIPSGVVFIVFGLALFAAWLGESERRARLGSAAALLAAVSLCASCSRPAVREAQTLTGGDTRRGVDAIRRYGCGSCHEIPGIRRADGAVGPSLNRVARRTYLAGQVANTPSEMMRWIQHPRQIEPGTAMPEMGVTDQDARDIAAYLYTLR